MVRLCLDAAFLIVLYQCSVGVSVSCKVACSIEGWPVMFLVISVRNSSQIVCEKQGLGGVGVCNGAVEIVKMIGT